ncbi:MAG: hypothetical protein HY606_07170 [Planctomycetes bacterium]|nr:hypothetical protein [Planctomycetota bacterium]
MRDKKFVTCLNCMDGRTQLPVIQWIEKNYRADYVEWCGFGCQTNGQSLLKNCPTQRHSRESGNPEQYFRRLDSRFRGNDVGWDNNSTNSDSKRNNTRTISTRKTFDNLLWLTGSWIQEMSQRNWYG